MDTDEHRQNVARTGDASNDERHNTYGPEVKNEPKQVIFNVFNVAPADLLIFGEQTKEKYEVLNEAMKLCCYVCTDAFDKVLEMHKLVTVEELTETVDLILTNLPVKRQTMKIRPLQSDTRGD